MNNRKLNIFLLSIFLILTCCSLATAIGRDELRLKAGLDLFPSLIAADLEISKKQGDDGFLTLLLIYTDNKPQAMEMSRNLKALKKIRGLPIHIKITNDLTMDAFRDTPPAGIFLTQPLGNHLSGVIDYAINNGVILFSPFKGDVERGVMGGLHISDRLLPFINMSSIKSSGIRIKKFFMRVAIVYEP